MDKANLTVSARTVLFFTFLIISGCSMVSVADIPDQSLKYSNDMAVVFGRLERLRNGQSVPYNTNELGSFISSDNKLDDDIFGRVGQAMMMHGFDKCGPPKGKNLSSTIRPDGYFFVVLPHGQQFINGICIKDGKWKLIPDQSPHLATFVVIPQKATYIGTIQVNETINETIYYKQKTFFSEEFFQGFIYGLTRNPSHLPGKARKIISKDEFMKLSSNEQDEYSEEKIRNTVVESWHIKNEFEEAKKIFTSLYPDHPELIEKLAEILLDSTK